VLVLIRDETAEQALDIIDFLLGTTHPYYSDDIAIPLDAMLREAGSAWAAVRLDDGRWELQRRVPDEAAAAFADVRSAGRSGEHLGRAWSAAFGRQPNPSLAYREAVKAVEAALKPIVSPSNDRATLGTMIADLKNAPAKWRVALGAQESFDSVSAFRSMVELLWKAQHDRHGTDDETAPLDIDQAAAEAAVHLAVTIVQWSQSKVIAQNTA
jgi:hypothetical protein